jgi:hypothetical protein
MRKPVHGFLTPLSKFDPVFVQLKRGREGLKDLGLGHGSALLGVEDGCN